MSPARSTDYTLLVKRGAAEDACRERIEVEGETQVASLTSASVSTSASAGADDGEPPGIAADSILLTQVPHTGAPASAVFPSRVFSILLAFWAAVAAYVFVVRRGVGFGLR